MNIFAPRALGVLSKNSPLASINEKNNNAIIKIADKVKIETDIFVCFSEQIYTFESDTEPVLLENGSEYSVVVVKNGQNFRVNNRYYCAKSNEIYVSNTMAELEEIKQKDKKTKRLTEDEQQALSWLDEGRKSNSSLTICYVLYPTLRKHSAFSSMEITHPTDTYEINRCIGFFKKVPNSFKRLNELSYLDKYWKFIVNNWDFLQEATLRLEHKKVGEALKSLQINRE